MDFGEALTLLKAGHMVARQGWNGKGMFLFLVPGSRFLVNRPPLLGIYQPGTEVEYCPHIDMKTADGKVVPWLASQTDLLAGDWVKFEKTAIGGNPGIPLPTHREPSHGPVATIAELARR